MKRLLIIFLILSSLSYSQSNDECLDCHSDDELTYERNGQEVSLFTSEKVLKSSTHRNLKCVSCHRGFDAEELPHREGKAIYQVNCGTCHKSILKNVKNDIHSRMIGYDPDEEPNCQSCHGKHDVQRISKINNPSEYFCQDCHDDTRITKDYHNKEFVSEETCFDCHDDAEEHKVELAESVHSDNTCVDCHVYAAANLDDHSEKPPLAIQEGCAFCHPDVAEKHKESIHNIMSSDGVEEAANCSSCHGNHKILSSDDPQSLTNPKNLYTTCGTCHDDPKFEEKFRMSVVKPGQMYSESIHGKLVEEGDAKAATCIACHGLHNIKTRVQHDSKIAPLNIPSTCEQCHPKETEDYKKSIHWMRVQRGIKDAPVCNDCHNEHSVKEIVVAGDKSASAKIQQETCISCHEESKVAKKYGKKGGQVEQYRNSYHGLAALRGDKDAALCVDCHNVHSILPSSFPEASTNKNNVTETCRRCHENATEVFSQSYSHETESKQAKAVENLVQNIYFWLIIVVIGGMALHNLIIFLFEVRKKRKREINAIRMPRFTRNEVIQHILLAVSFIVLAITGFALKYPSSFWADGLKGLGMTEAVRQWVHRASAVVMIVLSLYHIFYLILTERGRDIFKELLPNFKDITDVRDNIMYHLRILKKHPEFEQYDYAEKAEYWALVWGTFVMAATGLVLWFPTMVGDWAPVWMIKVSETIHFMEAILATLAILVWHWFFVIFRPSEYPMSFVWKDGKMTLDHYRQHHERHFKRILIEYFEYKNENHPRKKLTPYTKLFKETLEKSGFSLDNIIQNELNKDLELRIWFEEETSKLEEKLKSSN